MSIYLTWIQIYIMGDRRKSDAIIDRYKPTIKQVAEDLRSRFGYTPEKLYRGVLLDPRDPLSKHNLFAYEHVSFTNNKKVAEAFADPTSVYSQFVMTVKPNNIGHLITYTSQQTDFVWFDYRWAKHISKEFGDMITLWNQNETLLGKLK